MKIIYTNIIIVFLLLGIGVDMYYFSKQLRSEGNKCQSNPFTYGANIAEKSTASSLTCTCNFNSSNWESFSFDRNEIKSLSIGNPRAYQFQNFTIIENELKRK